jgi:hypothetical protein
MVPRQVRAAKPPNWLRSFDWDRFLLAKCAVFHTLVAFTIFVAPWDQLYNAGTAPVWDMAPRSMWAAGFMAGAIASGLAAHYLPRGILLFFVALMVFPLGIIWFAAFVLAVLQGHGSALSVVVWPFLYSSWLVAIARLGLGKR